MVLDFWTYVNPILRILIYLVALISIGTILFNFHFEKYLENDIKYYCNKILKSNSASGILLSIIVFFSIAGNLGGDIESIYNVDLINLSLETLQSKSILLLFVGFILLFFLIKNLNFLSKILYLLGTSILVISFIVVGHSFSSGIYSQLLVIVHVICISYWVGSFLPLRHICTINNCKNLHKVAHNFGVYAVIYISLLVITGLIFSYILLGGVSPLITSYYGNVLLIKILLVSIILMIGAINKFKIVPNIKVNQLDGQNKLKSSIEIEMIITFLVLLLTSILTTSLTTPLGV